MVKTILVIEDDEDILDMMTYILQDEGFNVISSTETVSVGYVQQVAPSLILLDNRLADGFGRDLCLKLKIRPRSNSLSSSYSPLTGSLLSPKKAVPMLISTNPLTWKNWSPSCGSLPNCPARSPDYRGNG